MKCLWARNRREQSGFILVVALAALAIMTILLLALFQGTLHQGRSAESAAIYAREKMLADTAAALVIGQIREASSQPGRAWISQPGLLRTYAPTTPRQPEKCYKLYSASVETDTSGTLNFEAADVPNDWNSGENKSFYTDLNAPASSGFLGSNVYPILDPAVMTNTQGSVSSDTGDVTMPVQWIYQLQDGTLGSASNGTKANPIVARIAYWTDDDTCKVNVNTAGCASPWNTPRVNSQDDVGWSTTVPAKGEFSRYPGHPAMTSLAGIFTTLNPQQLLGLTPRYGWGGSEFGVLTTVAGASIPFRTDRLYASLDELAFGTVFSGGQRQVDLISPSQVQQDRFVLTAHSESPETTLLGEPRVAIWPVSDAPTDATRTTAADRAVASCATLDAPEAATSRNYFFQRHSSENPTDDFDQSTSAGQSNVTLFNELLARRFEVLPGYGTTFQQKYPDTAWTQLMLEITDFIHGLNAIDPATGTATGSSGSAFVPFAASPAAGGVGQGFIVPLTTTDPTSNVSLRSFGRCPTLSSLTLVIYVSGFVLDGSTQVDFETMSAADRTSTWEADFDPTNPMNRLAHITGELLRAFIVPCTFQPGCGFPQVSDDCTLALSGLQSLSFSSKVASTNAVTNGNFGFGSNAVSPVLGTPMQVLLDRAWGGNEGPIAWRLAGDTLASGTTSTFPYGYKFAGGAAFSVPFGTNVQYAASTKTITWPQSPTLTTAGGSVTVTIQDPDAPSATQTLQTLSVTIPAFTVNVPTIDRETDHRDNSTPGTAEAGWATDSTMTVEPFYYMNLQNRLLATQGNRALMIQPGDVARGMQAATDLRVIAALGTVPSSFFQGCKNFNTSTAQAYDFRFADGSSPLGAYGANLPSPKTSAGLIQPVGYPFTLATTTGTNYTTGNGGASINDAWFIVPEVSGTPGNYNVTMTPLAGTSPLGGADGDWDTGPGFCPDGAMINLPDAGTSQDSQAAYFSLAGLPAGATRLAPNALVPSPVIFGSLPTGINPINPAQSLPWCTLLLSPNPLANFCATPPPSFVQGMHPGFASPPDYLVLDNFWMPTIEPYGISGPLATAGKINLNYAIVPFTYLHRDTALHALLSSVRIPAIPYQQGGTYKTAGTPLGAGSVWNAVDEAATIQVIKARLDAGDAFLSESEICSVPLIPVGQTLASLDNFWNYQAELTGDNLREVPYAQLYGRLTTRSNSYTVHLRVQVLKKLPADLQQGTWKEGTDLVLGDWRGSYEIERDLDPTAAAPSVSNTTTGQPLSAYHFRVVSARRFSP